jgi:hypothetical protein
MKQAVRIRIKFTSLRIGTSSGLFSSNVEVKND